MCFVIQTATGYTPLWNWKTTTELQILEVACFIGSYNGNVKECVGSRSPQNI
jgi:hypothetical protein